MFPTFKVVFIPASSLERWDSLHTTSLCGHIRAPFDSFSLLDTGLESSRHVVPSACSTRLSKSRRPYELDQHYLSYGIQTDMQMVHKETPRCFQKQSHHCTTSQVPLVTTPETPHVLFGLFLHRQLESHSSRTLREVCPLQDPVFTADLTSLLIEIRTFPWI